MAVCWTHTSQSLASSTLTVNARGPTAGAPPTTGPVAIDVHMAVTDTPPPQLRALGLRMPPGFATVFVPPCDANALRADGSDACAISKLGTGKASAYVPGLGSTVTTRELSIFRGAGDDIILYARIDTGIAGIRTALLPGVLGGRPTDPPLLKFQLDKIGMGAALTSADMTLTQGLQAGPCQTGSWTFRAQLEFVDAPPALTTPSVQCAPTPASAPAPPLAPSAPSAPSVPSLRASARNGTRASGARLALVLSEPATIEITLQRRAAGHWIAVRRLAVRTRAGSTSVTIRTAHERPLRAGRYRARLQAVNAAGAQSAPRTVRFTIRRGGMRRR
jgi:hypothetical protein